VGELDKERYRAESEECRRFAEQATSPLDKEAWLRLAAEWLKLAESVSSRH